MPNNNRVTKQELKQALLPAELQIAQFQPPATLINQNNLDATPRTGINIPEAQTQMAHKAAEERANALFDILIEMIRQVATEEIDRQQIVQKISNLDQRIRAVETQPIRNGTI